MERYYAWNSEYQIIKYETEGGGGESMLLQKFSL